MFFRATLNTGRFYVHFSKSLNLSASSSSPSLILFHPTRIFTSCFSIFDPVLIIISLEGIMYYSKTMEFIQEAKVFIIMSKSCEYERWKKRIIIFSRFLDYKPLGKNEGIRKKKFHNNRFFIVVNVIYCFKIPAVALCIMYDGL